MPKGTTRFSILIGASWYFLEKITRVTVAFLISLWVARHLGPEVYGALAYALALVAMLGFFGSLGIESLVVRDLVEGQRDQRRILSTYFFIRLAGSLLVPLLAAGYLIIVHDDRLLITLALLYSGAVVFRAYDITDCWLQARNEARATSSVRIIGLLGGALGQSLLIISNARVEWFAAVVMLESVLIAALYYRLLCRHELAPSLRYVSMAEFKHLVITGKMMVFSGLTVAVYSKIDVLVIGILLSKELVGSYAIAASMCAAWNMVGMSVTQAWAPRISSARARNHDEYIQSMRQLLLIVFVISLVGSILLSFSAETIFSLLLGGKYVNGAVIFSVLVWSSVFVFFGVATSQIIVNERIYWVSMLRTTVGLMFFLAAIFLDSSDWGSIEFAFFMVLTQAVATSGIIFSEKARSTIRHILSFKNNIKLPV